MLCKAHDMEPIGSLEGARNKSLTVTHNRPGSFSFTLDLEHEMAEYIWPLTSAVKLHRNRHENFFVYDDIWSGYVTSVDEDFASDKITVNCVGWLAFTERRKLRRDKVYTGNNPMTSEPWLDVEIIKDLIDEMNTHPITWDNSYTFPKVWQHPYLGYNATPLWWGSRAGDFSTHQRPLKFDKDATFGSCISTLIDMENGCDVWVDPATRLLHVNAVRGSVKSDVFFSFGTSQNNLARFSRQGSSDELVTYFKATAPNRVPAYADTQLNPVPTQTPPEFGSNSMSVYGLLEESESLSEAKTNEVLLAYAGAELLFRSSLRPVYTMAPFPFTNDETYGWVPEPFVEYNVGDWVYLNAKHGKRLNVNKQRVRVFSMSVAWDDNGNETITDLQLTPQ